MWCVAQNYLKPEEVLAKTDERSEEQMVFTAIPVQERD